MAHATMEGPVLRNAHDEAHEAGQQFSTLTSGRFVNVSRYYRGNVIRLRFDECPDTLVEDVVRAAANGAIGAWHVARLADGSPQRVGRWQSQVATDDGWLVTCVLPGWDRANEAVLDAVENFMAEGNPVGSMRQPSGPAPVRKRSR